MELEVWLQEGNDFTIHYPALMPQAVVCDYTVEAKPKIRWRRWELHLETTYHLRDGHTLKLLSTGSYKNVYQLVPPTEIITGYLLYGEITKWIGIYLWATIAVHYERHINYPSFYCVEDVSYQQVKVMAHNCAEWFNEKILALAS